MGMEGIVPVMDMNNDRNCCGRNDGWGSGWGGAGGAFAGALIGSWFGNGFMGNGWGNNRNDGGCCCRTATVDQVNDLGLQVLQGQNQANMAMCQGFSGVVAGNNANTASLNNTLAQGFAGLNTVITNGDAAIQQSLCQGFSGLNTAVLVASKDNALLTCQSTDAITSAIKDCCCTTQRTIMEQGCATRELIKDVQYQNTRDQLCLARDEISTLKSQNFTAGAVAGLGNQVRAEINQAVNNIILHTRAFLPSGTTTTPATAA